MLKQVNQSLTHQEMNYHFKNVIASAIIHLGLICEEPQGKDIQVLLTGLYIPEAISQIVDAKLTFEMDITEDKLMYFLNRENRRKELTEQLNKYLDNYIETLP